ncbi:MAG: hypothetical protein DRJ65_22035 [Acidobacteria bacterium]|nr:MAG: hypothetical protein DRJ65_22035 [Acidobacteriota bacterium]
MKGAIKPDHMPVNKYDFIILGMPSFTPITVSGIENELQTVDLPDRTKASGGNRNPSEVTVTFPMHHLAEQAALELWFAESQDPVSPTYKKVGTLIHKSNSGQTFRSYTMDGIFPSKQSLPELNMDNEGEQAVVEWTFQIDDLLPI